MMKPANQSRFVRHLFGSACIAALVAGCTTDESAPPPMTGSGSGSDPYPEPKPASPPDPVDMNVDPTGNWDLTYMFLPGCGQPAGTAEDTITVTLSSDGFAVSAGGAATMGTLKCTPDSCKLSAVFVSSDAGLQYQESANMVLDLDDNITGNGTVYVTDGMTACSFVFSVTGSRS